jgi:two-component system, OmpR family, response regulator CpxR
MPVVSIFSVARCHGDEVAEQVAEGLGYQILSNEKLLTEAAKRFKTSEEKLSRAMMGPRSVFNRLTHEKERSVAYLRTALAELIKDDNVVYHGFAGHLLPKSLNNVLRVCLVAKQDYRVKVAMKEDGLPEKDARKLISKEDEIRQQWTLYLFGLSPWEKSL